ncbi:hypothetical protein ACROYT_G027689 [Oculina patagonica]
MCASQQVGDSPSSSQQTKKSAISVNHEGGDSVRMCLFANGGQNHKSQVPPVCFGYAVLMYQRNSKLGMLQKLLSILLGSGGCSRRKTWVRAMDRIGSGLVSKVQKLVQEGFELCVNFDNLDFKIVANQVLMNHRKTDVHWINQYITFDRVPSTHLDDQKPLVDLKELPLTNTYLVRRKKRSSEVISQCWPLEYLQRWFHVRQ